MNNNGDIEHNIAPEDKVSLGKNSCMVAEVLLI